jgi:nucleotide-binding universal stress UspA family protein
MSRRRNHVVAGVAGGPASRAAAGYAAREAALRGTSLELVHVIPSGLPLDPRPLTRPGSLQSHAVHVLEKARRAALRVAPEVPVTLTLTSGARLESLLARSERAAMLVIGAPRSATAPLHPGSLVTAVSTRAPCPVTMVPAGDGEAIAVRRVVVGLKWPPHGDEALLGEAFATAERWRCDLEVVHAWRAQPAYDDLLAPAQHDSGWLPGRAALIEERIVLFRRSHPGVQVRVDVVRASAGDALAAAARPGALVMLSRTTHWWPGRTLGPTTRGVLNHTGCPVAVVPFAREHEAEPRPVLATAAGAAGGWAG